MAHGIRRIRLWIHNTMHVSKMSSALENREMIENHQPYPLNLLLKKLKSPGEGVGMSMEVVEDIRGSLDKNSA